jgi:hypothetical protein
MVVRYEGDEVLRFHGFGNETTWGRERTYYEAPRSSLGAAAGVRMSAPGGASVRVGPSLRVVRPRVGTETALVDELAPYGHGDFERIALDGALAWSEQDDALRPRLAGRLELSGSLAPAWLDVAETYGGVALVASARAALGGRLRPVIALRAGARRVWGPYPYFEAAELGGRATLRGYPTGRFLGDGAVHGGAEGRLFLTEHVVLFPGDLGLLAVADVGRVFVDGETSRAWHGSWGGGVWASFVDAFEVDLTWARGAEGTLFYLGTGVPF